MRSVAHPMRRSGAGEPCVDQGEVHGLPATWNPDDGKFYLHAAGTTDGTNVLGRFTEWRNLVQFARSGPKGRGTSESDVRKNLPALWVGRA